MGGDELEGFILSGDAREVDSFWAEKGMGYHPATRCMPWTDREGLNIKGGLPPYSTDRGLRYVIEDRVREVVGENEAYPREVARLTEKHYDAYDNLTFYEQRWNHINATNRQVILAAARAMGLTL